MMENRLTLAILFTMIAALASAHNGATGVVMERMQGMSAMEDGLKSIGTAMRGQAPYDQDAARATGLTIQTHASSMIALFEPGTDGGVSDALPNIWTDHERFAALAAELAELGESLSAVSSYNEARSLVARINVSCSTCHDDFRADD